MVEDLLLTYNPTMFKTIKNKYKIFRMHLENELISSSIVMVDRAFIDTIQNSQEIPSLRPPLHFTNIINLVSITTAHQSLNLPTNLEQINVGPIEYIIKSNDFEYSFNIGRVGIKQLGSLDRPQLIPLMRYFLNTDTQNSVSNNIGKMGINFEFNTNLNETQIRDLFGRILTEQVLNAGNNMEFEKSSMIITYRINQFCVINVNLFLDRRSRFILAFNVENILGEANSLDNILSQDYLSICRQIYTNLLS